MKTLWRYAGPVGVGFLCLAAVYLVGAVSGRPPALVRGAASPSPVVRSALDLCKQNLGRIGTALERWSVDHHGQYPRRLTDLVPSYLAAIPSCPAARVDTYSAQYAMTEAPPTFSIGCHADHANARP